MELGHSHKQISHENADTRNTWFMLDNRAGRDDVMLQTRRALGGSVFFCIFQFLFNWTAYARRAKEISNGSCSNSSQDQRRKKSVSIQSRNRNVPEPRPEGSYENRRIGNCSPHGYRSYKGCFDVGRDYTSL